MPKGTGINIPHIPSYNAKRTGTDFSGYSVFDFRGGLNTREPATMLADNESPDLINVNFDIAGSIVKRKGYTKQVFDSIPYAPETLLVGNTVTNQADYYLACANGKIMGLSNSAETQTSTTTNVISGLNSICKSGITTFLADDGTLKSTFKNRQTGSDTNSTNILTDGNPDTYVTTTSVAISSGNYVSFEFNFGSIIEFNEINLREKKYSYSVGNDGQITGARLQWWDSTNSVWADIFCSLDNGITYSQTLSLIPEWNTIIKLARNPGTIYPNISTNRFRILITSCTPYDSTTTNCRPGFFEVQLYKTQKWSLDTSNTFGSYQGKFPTAIQTKLYNGTDAVFVSSDDKIQYIPTNNLYSTNSLINFSDVTNAFLYTLSKGQFVLNNNSDVIDTSNAPGIDYSYIIKVGMSVVESTVNHIPSGTKVTKIEVLYNANGEIYNKIYLSNIVTGSVTYDLNFSYAFDANFRPKGRYMVTLKNRMFVCGDPANPNLIYFSDLANPLSWNPLNVISLNSKDNEPITGMAVFFDQIYIFKRKSIWGMFIDGAPSTWILRNVNDQYGTVSNKSIKILGNDLMFLGEKGVYGLHHTRVLEYFNVELKSFKIEPDILSMASPESACAISYKNQYWLSFPANNITYIYDMVLKSWTKFNFSSTSYYYRNNNLLSTVKYTENNYFVTLQDFEFSDGFSQNSFRLGCVFPTTKNYITCPFNATVSPIIRTVNQTLLNRLTLNYGDTNGLIEGMNVVGDNIPAGTQIKSIQGNFVYLTQFTTGTVSTASFGFNSSQAIQNGMVGYGVSIPTFKISSAAYSEKKYISLNINVQTIDNTITLPNVDNLYVGMFVTATGIDDTGSFNANLLRGGAYITAINTSTNQVTFSEKFAYGSSTAIPPTYSIVQNLYFASTKITITSTNSTASNIIGNFVFDQKKQISSYFKTKYFDFHMPERIKKIKKVLFFTEQLSTSSSVLMSAYYDFEKTPVNTYNVDYIPPVASNAYGSESSIYGTTRYGATGSAGELTSRVTMSGQTRFMQLSFSNNLVDQGFRLRGFTILNKAKSMR